MWPCDCIITIFIAVCGPVLGDCGADIDGWFLSDFYLMYEMFKSLGAIRRFYTTVEPKALLDRHDRHVSENVSGPASTIL